MTATMIDVDGGTVWADDSGGDGPPLVLLHPGVGDSRIWDPVLPALTEGYRVIRYDARGYGQSPPRRSVLAAARPDGGARPLRPDRVAIVGCSQGGGTRSGWPWTSPAAGAGAGAALPRHPRVPVWDDEPDEGDGLRAEWGEPRPPRRRRDGRVSSSASGAGPAPPRTRWSSSARPPAPS